MAMNILIGYHMRSGSTLLQHILNEHSKLQSFSDISSIPALTKILFHTDGNTNWCIKPLDLIFLAEGLYLYKRFDKFVWITRDPLDSYLSAVESGYAYLFWPKGRIINDIDVGLIERWQRVYKHYFFITATIWYLIRYEDLITKTSEVITNLLDYLELPHERLIPFKRFNIAHGGDYKLSQTTTIKRNYAKRFRKKMSLSQQEIFFQRLSTEMQALAYQ